MLSRLVSKTKKKKLNLILSWFDENNNFRYCIFLRRGGVPNRTIEEVVYPPCVGP